MAKSNSALASVVSFPLSEIQKNPKNPRVIKDGEYYRLLHSVREFTKMLKYRPIILESQENPIILGGNQRYAVAKELGFEDVPVMFADEFTDEEKNEFILRDNKSSGEWDIDSLSAEFDIDLLNVIGISSNGNDDSEFDENEKAFREAGENEPQYPIVQQYSEKYTAFIIISKSEIDDTFIRTALDLGKEKSYKGDFVKETNVVSAEKFIKQWNQKV